jgi:streptogramin lyase
VNYRTTAVLSVMSVLAAACSPPLQSGGSAMTPPLSQYADNVSIREFNDLLSKPYYSPWAIASGPNGDLWVTEDFPQISGENAIVQVSPAGKRLNVFYYGTVADFVDITAGPDGALWITDWGNRQILRMTTNGKFKGFPVDSLPIGITAGPDGALWFTDRASGAAPAIGRMTTKGKITFFTAGITAGAYLEDIVAGPDGALWFSEYSSGKIGRITTQGSVREYSHGITSAPYSIAVGPDKALWFTEQYGRIGRITTKGKITEYSKGISAKEQPYGIAAGPDQAMWFTESVPYYSGYDARIGRIAMDGSITEYSGFSQHAYPTDIVSMPDKKLWFVETASNKLGRVTP